jgi:hypothetical protein
MLSLVKLRLRLFLGLILHRLLLLLVLFPLLLQYRLWGLNATVVFEVESLNGGLAAAFT